MLRPVRDFLTIEQIADRWGLERIDVQQLILTRRLQQAFIISGLAQIFRTQGNGERQSHPLTSGSSASAHLLVSGFRPESGAYCWPLGQVSCIYAFFVDDRDESTSLKRFHDAECREAVGWRIEFEAASAEIIGQDLFKNASAALRDVAIVSAASLVKFEELQQIDIQSADEPTLPKHPRDTLKQRCRVAAQILWEKDRTATVRDLYKNDWVRRVACHDNPPTEKTFREWVKDLNPDRSPGRRPR